MPETVMPVVQTSVKIREMCRWDGWYGIAERRYSHKHEA